MAKTRYPISSKHGYELMGNEQLVRTLAGMQREMRKEVMVNALKEGAVPIYDDMKATTAFIDRSGALRNSIKLKIRKRSVAIVAGGKDAPHAIWIEYGHGKTRKGRGTNRGAKGVSHWRPFMRPAVDNNAAAAMERILRSLSLQIERITTRYLR